MNKMRKKYIYTGLTGYTNIRIYLGIANITNYYLFIFYNITQTNVNFVNTSCSNEGPT